MRFFPSRLALKYANRNDHIKFAVVPCFCVALMMFPVAYYFLLPTLLLGLAGKNSEAVVKSKLIGRTGKGRPTYSLEYKFEVGGKVFSGSASTTAEQWNAAHVGGPLKVAYLPANPKVNEGHHGDKAFLAAFAVLWLGTCAGVVWGVRGEPGTSAARSG